MQAIWVMLIVGIGAYLFLVRRGEADVVLSGRREKTALASSAAE
jgi:hypothetical protein